MHLIDLESNSAGSDSGGEEGNEETALARDFGEGGRSAVAVALAGSGTAAGRTGTSHIYRFN